MQKGRQESWGKDDTESMSIFYANGKKRKMYDEKFEIAGKFHAQTCSHTSKLTGWNEQHPLELLNARVYVKDATWVDTPHNATKFDFKTGCPSVTDWGGLVAPVGLFQILEEEVESCKQQLVALALDVAGSSCNTDGGSAWPAIVEEFDQVHTEDGFHNDKNGDEKCIGFFIKH